MKDILHINDYAVDIKLFDKFSFPLNDYINKDKIVDDILNELKEYEYLGSTYLTKRQMLRAKINTLAPNTLDQYFINKLNQLLQLELLQKKITSANELYELSNKAIGKTKISVYQGDITLLNTDAIVNAANNQMLGCFQPLHACIDNAIHSAAGVQLRDDCKMIMKKQGFKEPTGTAKITRAYNLPSKFVIHTVGPIVHSRVTTQNKNDLINSYRSCLEICKELEVIKSIAFCCISTGVFGYPQREAAEVAYETVTDWLKVNPNKLDLVVFNVFSDKDRNIYKSLVG